MYASQSVAVTIRSNSYPHAKGQCLLHSALLMSNRHYHNTGNLVRFESMNSTCFFEQSNQATIPTWNLKWTVKTSLIYTVTWHREIQQRQVMEVLLINKFIHELQCQVGMPKESSLAALCWLELKCRGYCVSKGPVHRKYRFHVVCRIAVMHRLNSSDTNRDLA